jgi:hypothetical protein
MLLRRLTYQNSRESGKKFSRRVMFFLIYDNSESRIRES